MDVGRWLAAALPMCIISTHSLVRKRHTRCTSACHLERSPARDPKPYAYALGSIPLRFTQDDSGRDAVETQAKRRATVLAVGSRGIDKCKVLVETKCYREMFLCFLVNRCMPKPKHPVGVPAIKQYFALTNIKYCFIYLTTN